MLVGRMLPVCTHPTHAHLVCSKEGGVPQLMALGDIDVVARLLQALDEHQYHNELLLHA